MTTTLTDWLYNQALPLWYDKGVDRRGGGFEEALGIGGQAGVYDYKRILVQARQIYVYSHAHIRDRDGVWLNAAASGFDFLTHHGWNSLNGGWHYSVTNNGQALNPLQDLYTQAFVLFASAWYSKASGSPLARDVIDRTWQFIESRLQHPAGGYYENGQPLGAQTEPRRQNPHMHLLEACLALYETQEEPVWMERADKLVSLALSHFIDTALMEFFDDDLNARQGKEQVIEPGHNYEWYWLLNLYRRLGGQQDVQQAMDDIYAHAQKFGHCPQQGLVMDQLDVAGKPVQQSSRLWPQTEWLKAQWVKAPEQADKPARLLKTYYLDGLDGLWTDQPMTAGTDITQLKSPASSFYHIYCSLEQMNHSCA